MRLAATAAMSGLRIRLEAGPLLAHDLLMQRNSLIVRSIWAVCLLIAGLNHAHTLFIHGLFWNYGGVVWASAVYWSSLTVIDPVTAALLFVRPKVGIVSTVLLISTNVLHNIAVTARYAPEGELLTRAANPFLIIQIGFMVFVAATARSAWKGAALGSVQAVQTR